MENVFVVLVQYVIFVIIKWLNLIRSADEHEAASVYFHLTYYRKSCCKYVNLESDCCVVMVSLVAGCRLKQWTVMGERVKEARVKVGELNKGDESGVVGSTMSRLIALVDAYSFFSLRQHKKAKDLCSKIINRSSL